MLNEEFLHYLWKYKLYRQDGLCTSNGECIEVIDPGEYNTNAGADFFNAKIKIGQTIWAGNVEVHVKSSDWNAHQHNKDKSYNNVILHVVAEDDKKVLNQNKKTIPTFVLKYPQYIYASYLKLKNSIQQLPCERYLSEIDPCEISLWIQRLMVERLELKSSLIERILKQTVNNWDEVFYRLLFRSFGFGINGDAFECLAQSLPLSILLKYCNDASLLESLLYGQAGFLDELSNVEHGEYVKKLKQDYKLLKQKHQLKSLDSNLWKFMRLRPNNFPTLRISQLANLLVGLKGSFDKLIKEPVLKELYKSLSVSASPYWNKHYTFKKESRFENKHLGRHSIEVIVINTIIPYLFTLGRDIANEEYKRKSIEWLSEMKPEKNKIISMWEGNKIAIKNAGDSQALIYLFNNYCKRKKCLYCKIGHKVLTIKE